jgi:class 3 adenylate cyclase/pimeloyl-ACP methyl ester carboxylesterase
MEQRIQFTRAADGARIAYAISGEGPTIISVPAPPDNHLQLEWDDPVRRRPLEHLSRFRRLVRFDGRGTGLSDRNVNDFSLEARVADLEAVFERLGVEQVCLLSGGHGNQVTVAFAAKHPERVSHLIAVNPFLRGSDFMSSAQLSMYQHMLLTDFKMFTDVVAAQTFGWGKEEGPRYAEYFRAAVDPATAAAIYDGMLPIDLSDYVPKVRCPVLVVRSAGSQMVSEGAAHDFAALVEDLHLSTTPGPAVEGATGDMLQRFAGFFGEQWEILREEQPAASRIASQPAIRIVLFTDIEDHTSMMTRLGDAAGREVLRAHEVTTRQELRAFGGTEVKTMGDGFLASFTSAQAAMDCAVSLHRNLSSGEHGLPPDFRIRVGINAGEPIAEDGDLFGSAVITAARILSLAKGGEVLVSNVVRELVAGKGNLFEDRGFHPLRGFDEPVRLWSLRWRGE